MQDPRQPTDKAGGTVPFGLDVFMSSEIVSGGKLERLAIEPSIGAARPRARLFIDAL